MFNLNLFLTYCSCNYEAGQYEEGITLEVVLTANSGYGFSTPPTLIMSGTSQNFNISEDKKTATLTFVMANNCSIRATAVEGTEVETELTYCYSTPSTFPIIFNGDTIEFTLSPVNENYEFKIPPVLTLYYFEGTNTHTGTKQGEDYYFSVTTRSDYDLERAVIEGVANIKTSVSKYGLINIYSPTMSDLINLSQTRFIGENKTDIGEFIIALKKLYCNIPVIGQDVINLGYYYTNVPTNVVNTDSVIVDCGSITVNELYANGFDYSPNTIAEIFLPLIGFNVLDTNSIMGKTINLKYYFNIVTGEINAILKDSNDVLIATFTGEGGLELPFIYSAINNKVLNNVKDNTLIYAGFTPFIKLTSNIPYYPIANNPNDTEKRDIIGNYTGYLEAQEVALEVVNDYITSREVEEIKQLIANGVVI